MKKLSAIALATTLSGLTYAATPAEIAAEAIRSTPIKGAERVEAKDATDIRYTYWIWYRRGEGSVQRARTDTQRLVRATLAGLVKEGIKPTEDWKFIHAHAAELVPGETSTRAADLGDAHYDFNTDQIEFKPPKR